MLKLITKTPKFLIRNYQCNEKLKFVNQNPLLQQVSNRYYEDDIFPKQLTPKEKLQQIETENAHILQDKYEVSQIIKSIDENTSQNQIRKLLSIIYEHDFNKTKELFQQLNYKQIDSIVINQLIWSAAHFSQIQSLSQFLFISSIMNYKIDMQTYIKCQIQLHFNEEKSIQEQKSIESLSQYLEQLYENQELKDLTTALFSNYVISLCQRRVLNLNNSQHEQISGRNKKSENNLFKKYKDRSGNYMKKVKYLKDKNPNDKLGRNSPEKQLLLDALQTDDLAQEVVQALLKNEKLMDEIFYRILSEQDMEDLSPEQLENLRQEFRDGVYFEIQDVTDQIDYEKPRSSLQISVDEWNEENQAAREWFPSNDDVENTDQEHIRKAIEDEPEIVDLDESKYTENEIEAVNAIEDRLFGKDLNQDLDVNEQQGDESDNGDQK